MEKLKTWVINNKAPACIAGLIILFFLAHLWYPIIYLYYIGFAAFVGYFLWKTVIKKYV